MLWTLSLALAGPPERPHVVLVSLDTTRADALSCYGALVGPGPGDRVITPNIDRLAAGGARFERFYATAPSTLSSHTTMLSGRDQHRHTVVRNGYQVPADVPTLPERLAGAGYDTIGVLGAKALEQPMGLDRGFRVYDDQVDLLRGIMYQDDAEGVVQRTFAAVDGRPDPLDPLFLFVHFYDPHTPYVPPRRHQERIVDPTYQGRAVAQGAPFQALTQAVRRGGGDPADVRHVNELYLAEVAYVDEQIGVLMAGLEARGLLEHALVVLVADHGETLVDDPVYAWSHGSYVGHEVMWVPLIVRGYGVPVAARAVVRRQASMVGLAGTVERLVGLEPRLGPDFAELLRPGPVFDVDGWPDRPTLPVFVEATRPRHAESSTKWNNLPLHRGVFAGGWGLWSAPWLGVGPTFYAERWAGHRDLRRALAELLAAWDADVPPHREAKMAPSTERALRALGYLE